MKKLTSAFIAILLLAAFSCTKEPLTSAVAANPDNSMAVTAKNKVGRQLQITVPTSDYTYPTSEALLWLPNGYNKASQAIYPLLICLDGVGEQGKNINLLLHNGTVAKRIADGWNATAVCPTNNRTKKFIVFTPQCPIPNGWGWSAPHVKTMLAYLKENYRIDTNRIYLTGYSAGGWGLWSCVTDDTSLCKQFAAIGPVSTASADHPDKIPNVDKYRIACWNICGTADAFYNNAVNYTNIINSNNPPIPAILTGLQGVGHSAWNQAYDPTWRANDLNFYEWLLQYKRNKKKHK
jgi:predicted peptidase